MFYKITIQRSHRLSHKNNRLKNTTLSALLFAFSAMAMAQENQITNPVAPEGSDPWLIQHNDLYLYCYSRQEALWINTNHTPQAACQLEGKKVWSPPSGADYSKELWAPELHFLRGKWYIYFAADDGDNANHRMYVLESKTADPLSEYTFLGKLSDPSDKWAIDGTPLEHRGELYFVWSGWKGDKNIQQNLYIAKMAGPKTIVGERVKISEPEHAWEKIGRPLINEGPQVLKSKDSTFVIYSASGSWTDSYCLGQLKLTGRNPLLPKSWAKSKKPVFSSSETVFGPGHASFVKSPDGQEDWIVYHTAKHSGAGWNRDVNLKRFGWDANGNPDFGTPAEKDAPFPAPSGN